MPTTAGTTARGLPYPGDTGAADGPAAFKALADAIETMMNSALVLSAGAVTVKASGGAEVDLWDSGATSGVRRSRLRTAAGFTYLQGQADGGSSNHNAFAHNHATGIVDFPQGFTGRRVDSPYFRAYRSTAASYADAATVIFNTETDPNGWYDHTTGIFLPTVAGMYRVSWRVEVASGALATDQYVVARLERPSNGGIVSSGSPSWQRAPGSPPLQAASQGADLIPFNGTTDSVVIAFSNDSGGAVAVVNSSLATHFAAERIGA